MNVQYAIANVKCCNTEFVVHRAMCVWCVCTIQSIVYVLQSLYGLFKEQLFDVCLGSKHKVD